MLPLVRALLAELAGRACVPRPASSTWSLTRDPRPARILVSEVSVIINGCTSGAAGGGAAAGVTRQASKMGEDWLHDGKAGSAHFHAPSSKLGICEAHRHWYQRPCADHVLRLDNRG